MYILVVCNQHKKDMAEFERKEAFLFRFRFSRAKYGELKQKGFRLEF